MCVWIIYVSNRFVLTTMYAPSLRAALNEALTGEVQRLKLSATTSELGDGGSSSNLAQKMQLRCQNQMLELHKQQQQQIPFYQLEQPEQNGAASRTHESK